MVPSLKMIVPPLIPPPLPYRFRIQTGFTGVNVLDLSNNYHICVAANIISALASLPGLRSLNLARNTMESLTWTTLGPTLTGLTYLNMAHTNVGDEQLARVTPFLSSLTNLNLQGYSQMTLNPGHEHYYPTYLATLTALTHLDLVGTAVTAQGLNLLAPLAPHLASLFLGGMDARDLLLDCAYTS
jgi:hypothetical protein